MLRKLVFVSAMSLMAAAGPATAGIIRADFEQILDLPTAVQNPSEGARVLRANDRTITPLDELTSADQVQNPSNWNGMLNVDLDSSSLTLRHDGGFTDFQVVSIMISDIVFSDPNEFISDVKLIVGGPSIVDGANSDPFTETLTFTKNGIFLTFIVNDFSPDGDKVDVFKFFEDGLVEYRIDIETSTTTDVPEPATLALFGTAFAGLTLFRRRRARH